MVQTLMQQVLAQAASVVVLVALLRLLVRRIAGRDPSADALLGLNLLANTVITVALLLSGGWDFAQPATYGVLALVALGATVVAHGGYDLVATRAKGKKPAAAAGSAPSPAPVPGDYPPGAPSIRALGLPTE